MPKVRKILNDGNAPYIQSLARLIETQSKITLANWAIDYSDEVFLPLWYKYYPEIDSPKEAIASARQWLKGEIKLPKAKSAILACHDAARKAEENPVAQAAARAIGQAASTIHSARHCIGIAFYGALALAYEYLGTSAPWDQIEKFASEECEKMKEALIRNSIENEENPAKINWKF